MAGDDVTLQDLIVRALTGMDERAKKSLERATAADPKLKQFYAELDEVVAVLAGSKDWRNEKPSAELTQKIRNAVAEKLSSAPPQFRTVMLEADLGRKRTLAGIVLAVIALIIVILGAMEWFNLQHGGSSGGLLLKHQLLLESTLRDSKLDGWESVGNGAWESTGEGLNAGESDDASATFLKQGYDAEAALAFEIVVKAPELAQQSSIIVFLAEASGTNQPAFNPGVRPAQALAVEIGKDGIVLSGPDQPLLHSLPAANQQPHDYRVRLEHLGARIRVLIDGNVFFEGPIARPLRENLHPGVRVSGPKTHDVRFTDARVEK
jgi:hypothetical protein